MTEPHFKWLNTQCYEPAELPKRKRSLFWAIYLGAAIAIVLMAIVGAVWLR